eukprot:m.16899 g.16899  ORF g.16899 m.16899 type:complete len:184 (-) comp5834_c0_seq2:190-741(-)
MLLKLKAQKQKEQGGPSNAAKKSGPKTTASMFRVTTDHNELQLPPSCALEFDNPDDLNNFRLVLKPDEGIYSKGRFVFTFNVGDNYPHAAPKVHCDTKVYHPNIDRDGNICLNILREDWRPVLNLQAVIFGLVYLFLEPNPDDPLHKEAAEVMRKDRSKFIRNVDNAMNGGSVAGHQYDRCLR